MIKISSWRSKLATEFNKEFGQEKYNATFTYYDNNDDRSGWMSDYIAFISEEVITVNYLPEETSLAINNNPYRINELSDYKIPDGRILIDATSLALPELLHLFNILNEKKRAFDVIYVQPNSYSESKIAGLDSIKYFDLSDDGLGVQQLPPYIGFSAESEIFFFLGWEGHRLGAVINSDEFNTRDITCLLGIPPFKTGWENKTLTSNYKHLIELNNTTCPQFKYAGANDPLKTYEVIDEIYQSKSYEEKWLTLAPFGTKPAAIAAANFAVNNKSRLILLYDFVKKKHKRSEGTDLVHLWTFECVE